MRIELERDAALYVMFIHELESTPPHYRQRMLQTELPSRHHEAEKAGSQSVSKAHGTVCLACKMLYPFQTRVHTTTPSPVEVTN